MSHTGLVSLPVPVVGQQNSTLLHVPVVPRVLASRARVVVGTDFPLLFHFSYHSLLLTRLLPSWEQHAGHCDALSATKPVGG